MSSKNRLKLIALYMILVVGIGSAGFFAVVLTLDIMTARESEAFFDSVAIEFVPRQSPTANLVQLAAEPDEAYKEVEHFEIDFDGLRESFPSVIGWIQSEGTPINFPIVQGIDNDFYLYHLPNRQRNSLGSIYMDYRNNSDFSSKITIIYGHDVSGGAMFGSLRNYRSQEFFEEHHSMFIFTPEQNYELLLFAGYILDSAFEIPPMSFSGPDDFYAFISNIKNRSMFSSDRAVSYGDNLVMLATCVAAGSRSDRLIIAGKMVPIE